MAYDKQFRRAILGAAPVAIGLACAAEPGPGDEEPLNEPPVRIEASQAVTDRVEGLGDRFRIGGPEGSAVLGAGAAVDYLRDRGRFDVRFHERSALQLSLPATADGAVAVAGPGGVAARFALVGAAQVEPELGDGVAVYAGAAPGGGDLIHRITPSAIEDFLVLDAEPEASRVSYTLDVSRAAGLRQVGAVLELLDAKGAPRLRMAAPYLVDTAGERHAADVTVEGCAVDARGVAPWGRDVVPPGERLCTVHVSWDSTEVRYPALLDPAWTATTGAMVQNRMKHTATRLATGEVLIVGGERPATVTEYLSSVELYDPTSMTFAEITFTATPTGRSEHIAALRSDGSVVVAGGTNGTDLATTEILTDITGTTPTLTSGGDLTTARSGAKAVVLSNDDVLIAGGVSTGSVLASTEIFGMSGGTWTAGGTMSSARRGHVLVKLGSGPPMVIAGITTTSTSDVNTVQFYDTNTNTWQTTAPLAGARYFHAGAVLSDGRVVVAGGYQRGVSDNIASSEIFDPALASWSSAGTAGTARQYHTVTALDNGSAVLAGGAETTDGVAIQTGTYKATSYLFDPVADSWDTGPTLATARAHHTATLLADGTVLVTGGQTPIGVTATAEVLGLDADGTACTGGNTCASGFCVDDVCCDAACDGLCESCLGASTGGADGVCAPVSAGTDPDSECTDDGALSCARNGMCSGIAGGCQTYGTSPCTPNACLTGADCTSGWCVDGICCDESCAGTCEACTAALKGEGSDGQCGPIVQGTDPEDECVPVGSGACAGEGVCDGIGSCEAETTGAVCAPLACINARTLGYEATCDDQGECATQSTLDCGLYACDSTNLECLSSCADDSDCAPGIVCQSGSCLPQPNGTACIGGVDCQSGYCIDGVCCEESCNGNCEACDVPGSEGSCVAVTGEPRGDRQPCTGTGTCGGRCDGVDRNNCTFPGPETECGESRCSSDSLYREVCTGSGDCMEELIAVCDPYGCGTDECLTECESDSDCRSGFRCDGNKECVDESAPFCIDGETAQDANGETQPCLQYACSQGACLSSCTTDEDCAEGATCFLQQNVCVFPSDSGGCGCRLAPTRASERLPATLAVLGLGLLAARRRRRAV